MLKFEALAVLLLSLAIRSALAHESYPADCCNGKDCAPVNCAEIRQIGPAVWRHGKATFNANAIRQPIDSRCHICKSEPLGRCIFFPLPLSS